MTTSVIRVICRTWPKLINMTISLISVGGNDIAVSNKTKIHSTILGSSLSIDSQINNMVKIMNYIIINSDIYFKGKDFFQLVLWKLWYHPYLVLSGLDDCNSFLVGLSGWSIFFFSQFKTGWHLSLLIRHYQIWWTRTKSTFLERGQWLPFWC